jgi:hypothetical protein
MSTRTLTMRSIRELYRLKFEAGLSHQQIARAVASFRDAAVKRVEMVAEAEAWDRDRKGVQNVG